MSTPLRLVAAAVLIGTLVVLRDPDQTESKECQEWNAQQDQRDKVDRVFSDQERAVEKEAREIQCDVHAMERLIKSYVSNLDKDCEQIAQKYIKLKYDWGNARHKLSDNQPKHCRRVNQKPR